MLTGHVEHDDYEATDGMHLTKNKRAILRQKIKEKKQRVPPGFRQRVWRRADYKAKRQQVMMLESDAKNCTFEPETAALSKNIAIAVRKFPESRKIYEVEAQGIAKFAESMGVNF